MSKYKALILDLDGTVVPSRRDGMPSEKVKRAIIAAQGKVIVSIATGRPFILAEHILKELEIKYPCIVDGGAEIIDLATGRMLFKKYISPQKQVEVIEICKRFNIPVASSEDQYGSNLLNPNSEITKEAAKLFIDGVTKETALALLEEFEAVKGIAPHLASSWNQGDVVDIHITDALATKKHGVEELLRILNLKPEEVIGVGDHHNDLPLLSSVGLKVVVANAPKEVQAIADYVAPSLEDDGVADVIEKFILSPDK